MSQNDSLFDQLRGGTVSQRLSAARQLASVATRGDLSNLQERRRVETNSWVRSAIDTAIARVTMGKVQEHAGVWSSTPADPTLEEVHAIAIRESTRMLVHDARPLLQRVEVVAKDAISEYEGSATEQAIGRLRELLQAMERLADASASPTFVEFDLRDSVLKAIEDAGASAKQVSVPRSEPLSVTGDPSLLSLVLVNLLRNAVESLEGSSPPPVVITFGTTDVEVWVIVLDEGRGLPAGKFMEPGQTTKNRSDHFGYGLTIAERAARSFRAAIRLSPRQPRGTAAEVRWPLSISEGQDDPSSGS